MKMNRKLLGLLGMGHAVVDINQGALPIILAFLQPVFALSQMQIGLAILAFNLSSSVIQPIFGIFSDRYRAVWLIPLGCLLGGLGMTCTGFSGGYAVLLLAVFLSGLGVAAYHPEGSKYAYYSSGERRASGMSLFSVGGNVGFAVGPMLAVLFYGMADFGGSAGFLVIGAVMTGFLLLNLSALKKTEQDNPAPSSAAETGSRSGDAKKATVPVIFLLLVIMLRSFTHFGIITFLPEYYVHYLHYSKTYAAVMLSVFLLAGAFGTLIGGPAADRYGRKTTIVCSMALLIPLLYLFAHTGNAWAPVMVVLTGFTIISTFAVTVVFGQELMPNNVGLASGLTLGLSVGMGGVGTTLLGLVADRWGLPMVFNVIIFFPMIALLLALFLPGRKKTEH
jgi:FSR family fosmidomycin resistance protein-like MFS transporter